MDLHLKGDQHMGSHTIINALNDELARARKGTSTDTINLKNDWAIKLRGVLELYAAEEKKVLAK